MTSRFARESASDGCMLVCIPHGYSDSDVTDVCVSLPLSQKTTIEEPNQPYPALIETDMLVHVHKYQTSRGAKARCQLDKVARDIALYFEIRARCPQLAEIEDITIALEVFGTAEGLDHRHLHSIPGYSLGKIIGEGSYCQVRLGIHHLSHQVVAIKVFDKTKFGPDEVRMWRREINIMKHLSGNESCITILESLEKDRWTYVVLEYATGGSLLDYVREKHLKGGEAARLLDQMVDCLQCCHARGVVHRDIKLENVMLENGNVKLIDFGLAAFFQPDSKLVARAGSPSYVAPEILAQSPYDESVDVWSLGVLLFALLTGSLPFLPSPGKNDLFQKVIRGQYDLSQVEDASARDLITKMLDVDPAHRIKLSELKQHPWLMSNRPADPRCCIGAASDSREAHVIDEEALALIEESSGNTRAQILDALEDGEICDMTASYKLITEASYKRGTKRVSEPCNC